MVYSAGWVVGRELAAPQQYRCLPGPVSGGLSLSAKAASTKPDPPDNAARPPAASTPAHHITLYWDAEHCKPRVRPAFLVGLLYSLTFPVALCGWVGDSPAGLHNVHSCLDLEVAGPAWSGVAPRPGPRAAPRDIHCPAQQ